jgi:3-methyladenine DNA glycosylase AlkD
VTADSETRAARQLLDGLDDKRRLAPDATTATLRRLRRALSRDLRSVPRSTVLLLANALVDRDGYADRFLAYELVAAHAPTMSALSEAEVQHLGRGLGDWGGVDCFACYVAGPAWREGRLSDRAIARWLGSSDRWWRRAAVASTVALNSAARGGDGDSARTLRIAALAADDRDPMVVKALSWALRELTKRDPAAVRRFVTAHADRLAALVRREVTHKLDTGRKNPRKTAARRSLARSS